MLRSILKAAEEKPKRCGKRQRGISPTEPSHTQGLPPQVVSKGAAGLADTDPNNIACISEDFRNLGEG